MRPRGPPRHQAGEHPARHESRAKRVHLCDLGLGRDLEVATPEQMRDGRAPRVHGPGALLQASRRRDALATSTRLESRLFEAFTLEPPVRHPDDMPDGMPLRLTSPAPAAGAPPRSGRAPCRAYAFVFRKGHVAQPSDRHRTAAPSWPANSTASCFARTSGPAARDHRGTDDEGPRTAPRHRPACACKPTPAASLSGRPWLGALRAPHPDPPPQGGRDQHEALPPCGGGSGWGGKAPRNWKTAAGRLEGVAIT